MLRCYRVGNADVKPLVTDAVTDLPATVSYRLGMVPKRKDQLFIKAWMDHLEVSDQELGERLGRPRETIWRWHKEQHRLNPDKIALIAGGLGITVEDLHRPPKEISLDAIIKEAPELRETAAAVIRTLIRQRKRP